MAMMFHWTSGKDRYKYVKDDRNKPKTEQAHTSTAAAPQQADNPSAESISTKGKHMLPDTTHSSEKHVYQNIDSRRESGKRSRMSRGSSGKRGFDILGSDSDRYEKDSRSKSRERPNRPRSRMSRDSSGKRGFDILDRRRYSSSSLDSDSGDSRSKRRRPNRSRSRMSRDSSGKRGFDILDERRYSSSSSYSDSDEMDSRSKRRKRRDRSRSRMSRDSSGKWGFDILERRYSLSSSCSDSDEMVEPPVFTSDREFVMRMLKREKALRVCEETQKVYDALGQANIPDGSIEDSIQTQVLREHGIVPTKKNLYQYRCINGLYINDPQVRNLIMYMKHDRSSEGSLRVGHAWPDVDLYSYGDPKKAGEGYRVRLSELYRDHEKFLLLIGASGS